MERKEVKKLKERIEKFLMKVNGCISIDKDYYIKELFRITNEKDKSIISFVLGFRMTSYGRGRSKILFIEKVESKFPYTCRTLSEEVIIK